MARSFGLEVEVLTPRRGARALAAAATSSDLVGAVFLPKDGQTNPGRHHAGAGQGRAQSRGARIFEETPGHARSCVRNGPRSPACDTDAGEIARRGGGELRRHVGARARRAAAGVSVPLHAAEHFYIVTEPIPGLPRDLPVLRDADDCAYFKEDAGKLLVGWFEPVAKPWGDEGHSGELLPSSSCRRISTTSSRCSSGAMRRVPVLGETGIQLFFNGPESFTPDDRYLLGEAPELADLFVAAGFNSIGIQSAGGAGKVLADWILDGHPPMDLWDVDIRRAMPFQRNRRYLRDRTVETLGLLYAMHWPYRQVESARGVRQVGAARPARGARAPASARLAGWERPTGIAPAGQSTPRLRVQLRPAELVRALRRRAPARCARRSGCSTSPRFAKFVVEGPRCGSASLDRISRQRRRRARRAASSTRSGSTSAAASRRTSR